MRLEIEHIGWVSLTHILFSSLLFSLLSLLFFFSNLDLLGLSYLSVFVHFFFSECVSVSVLFPLQYMSGTHVYHVDSDHG